MATLAVLIGIGGIGLGAARGLGSVPPRAGLLAQADEYRFARLPGPERTSAIGVDGTVVATFTDGARTATLAGPERTFAEPQFTTAAVTTPVWVRLLPQPWYAGAEAEPWFQRWLAENAGSTAPDLLTAATDYLDGAPPVVDGQALRVAGDAGFGPPGPPGQVPLENSDFYDYLGVSWTFPGDRVQEPDSGHYGDVDCSGFIRLVYGYRMGYPLRDTNDPGPGLPRRAYAMAEFADGAVVVPDDGTTAEGYSALQTGDLLFFNLDAEPRIDHSAIYLGRDNEGHHRFLSSRGRADGPTLGDLGGTSLLDDGGNYSQSFRTAKRI